MTIEKKLVNTQRRGASICGNHDPFTIRLRYAHTSTLRSPKFLPPRGSARYSPGCFSLDAGVVAVAVAAMMVILHLAVASAGGRAASTRRK